MTAALHSILQWLFSGKSDSVAAAPKPAERDDALGEILRMGAGHDISGEMLLAIV